MDVDVNYVIEEMASEIARLSVELAKSRAVNKELSEHIERLVDSSNDDKGGE